MRKWILCAVALVIFGMLAVSRVDAFKCGPSSVDVGNTKSDVVWKCGEPNWVDSREEDRMDWVSGYTYSPGGRSLVRVPVAVPVRVTVEEWFYNYGPTKFIRILRFVNDRLVQVDTGGYGF